MGSVVWVVWSRKAADTAVYEGSHKRGWYDYPLNVIVTSVSDGEPAARVSTATRVLCHCVLRQHHFHKDLFARRSGRLCCLNSWHVLTNQSQNRSRSQPQTSSTATVPRMHNHCALPLRRPSKKRCVLYLLDEWRMLKPFPSKDRLIYS